MNTVNTETIPAPKIHKAEKIYRECLAIALADCATEQGAYCLQHQETPGAMARRLRAITDIVNEALASRVTL